MQKDQILLGEVERKLLKVKFKRDQAEIAVKDRPALRKRLNA